MKDWTGNTISFAKTAGFSTGAIQQRESNDFYATPPLAAKQLLSFDTFSNVWEMACGQGHIAEVLNDANILSKASDLIDRGYGEIIDFLTYDGTWEGDLITNPPYRYTNEFIIKSMQLLHFQRKLALFLPIRYLASESRAKLYKAYPPFKIWVNAYRLSCGINGKFGDHGAVDYAWFIWHKDFNDETKLGWFNSKVDFEKKQGELW